MNYNQAGFEIWIGPVVSATWEGLKALSDTTLFQPGMSDALKVV